MILAWLLLLTGLIISAVAIYYSVIGLAAIFAAATIPIYIMGGSLEVAKLVCASWLKANWNRAPGFMKAYMSTAIIVLMIITSMGIFGFLSKAHTDQSIVSGDASAKLAIYDEKIKTEKENIEANRKALRQMDEAVDQSMARSTTEQGANRAVSIRQQQARERTRLQNEISASQKKIAGLNEERAPIAAENRKIEAEVGPIKYIAALIYGDNPDSNLLEKAVTWVIIMIVIVFDPLAVVMLLAAQMTFAWRREDLEKDYMEEHFQEVADAINDAFAPDAVKQSVVEQPPEPAAPTKVDPYKITPETHAYLYKPWVDRVPEEFRVGPQVYKPEPKQPEETPHDLELWNKMLEEADKAVQEEREKFETGQIETLPESTVEKFEEEKLVEEVTEYPANPFKGQRIKLRFSADDVRDFIYNGDQWIDFDHSDPETVRSLEEDSKKKSRYMTKDPKGKIQVKDRL